MSRPFLYLASRSVRRRVILRRMGVPFRVVPSRYIEEPLAGVGPAKLVVRHAAGKAHQAEVPKKEGWVLGADTIVYCRGRIFGKPRNMREAFRMLTTLSKHPHWVYTGVALFHPSTGRMRTGYAKTKVVFRQLSGKEIRGYLRKVNPLDKAGSYDVRKGSRIVRFMRGSFSNVVGLPAGLVRSLLSEMLGTVLKGTGLPLGGSGRKFKRIKIID